MNVLQLEEISRNSACGGFCITAEDVAFAANPAIQSFDVKARADRGVEKHLAVMDSTATSLASDNSIPVVVFALKDPENIWRVVTGEQIGTIVEK